MFSHYTEIVMFSHYAEEAIDFFAGLPEGSVIQFTYPKLLSKNKYEWTRPMFEIPAGQTVVYLGHEQYEAPNREIRFRIQVLYKGQVWFAKYFTNKKVTYCIKVL